MTAKRGKLTIRPVTPALWPDLAQLFGEHGACNGCWCMYWRIGSGYYKRPREKNQADFRKIVKKGPPPGLLAFDGDIPVGWCQLTPRDDLASLDRSALLARVDDLPVWSITCFYIKKSHRRKGVATGLIDAAVKEARAAKAPALEAYPIDTTKLSATWNLFTGVASVFRKAGFRTVVRRKPHRPIMRHDLKRSGAATRRPTPARGTTGRASLAPKRPASGRPGRQRRP